MRGQQKLFSAIALVICANILNASKIRACTGSCETTAKAVCVMEQSTRRVLYEERGDIRLPMASTTKIATAITILDCVEDISAEYAIPESAVGVEGSSVYLQSGEIYTIEELLYGLMLRSGNDCATALALACSESLAAFSTKMNETAERSGCLSTRFQNPHGLPCEGHYTTARDLSNITAYALENPKFREIVSTQYYEKRGWRNKNKMLGSFDGAIGVKTGYTKEAGRCLVSAAERDGMTLVCTVLSCQDTYAYSKKLLEDAFACYHQTKLLDKDTVYEVESGNKTRKGKLKEDFYFPLMDGEENQIEIVVKSMEDKEIIGQIEIYLAKRLLFSGNLYKL